MKITIDYEYFDGFALIRFYVDWYAPFAQNVPVFEQRATQMSAQLAQIKFSRVNVDQSPFFSYAITSIACLQL